MLKPSDHLHLGGPRWPLTLLFVGAAVAVARSVKRVTGGRPDEHRS